MLFSYVPTLNNELTIEKTLKSILNQTVRPDKIVVIDSGSTDNTQKITESLGVEFLSPAYFGKEFLGLGRARNYATLLAKEHGCDFVLSTDSDVVLKNDYLEHTYTFMKENPGYSGITGKLIDMNRSMIGDRFRVNIIMSDMKETLDKKIERQVEWISGSQNIYRVDDLLDCGNFDENLPTNFEDNDIGIKLASKGRKVYFMPRARAYHLQKDTFLGAVDRFYRYEVDRYARQGAFENIEKYYDIKLSHTVRAVDYIGRDTFNRARSYLLYGAFLVAYMFKIRDAIRFAERENQKENGYKIAKASLQALSELDSDIIRRGIETDLAKELAKIADYPLGECEPDREITEFFKRVNSLGFLDKSYPAVHQNNVEQTSKELKMKVAESSRLRVEYEESNEDKIYGKFRVLLVNAPWKPEGRYGIRAGSRWPHTNQLAEDQAIPVYIPFPFFMAQTLKLLRQSGMGAHMIDAIAEGYNRDEFFYEAVGYEPDLVIIETSTPSFKTDLEWAEKIKEWDSSIRICLVGPHIAHEKDVLLDKYSFVDYAVNGEYEFAVNMLAKALKDNDEISSIKGLIYREDNKNISNGKTDPVDVKKLPNPDRITLPYYNYNDRPIRSITYPSLQVILSRGCPFGCTFCLWPQIMFNENYQTRNIEDVIAEIKEGINTYGITSFYVDDDTFNINRNHLLKFAAALQQEKINLPWMAMARGDTVVDRETLQRLKDSGLVAIKYGVESTDEKVLAEMNKKLNLEKTVEAVRVSREIGLEVHLTFSVGYFADTAESIRNTFCWSLAQGVDSIQISIVTPFPGTVMYHEAKKRGIKLEDDYDKYDGARYTVVARDDKQYLQDVVRSWYRLFRVNKGAMELNKDDAMVMFYGLSYEELTDAERSKADQDKEFADFLSKVSAK